MREYVQRTGTHFSSDPRQFGNPSQTGLFQVLRLHGGLHGKQNSCICIVKSNLWRGSKTVTREKEKTSRQNKAEILVLVIIMHDCELCLQHLHQRLEHQHRRSHQTRSTALEVPVADAQMLSAPQPNDDTRCSCLILASSFTWQLDATCRRLQGGRSSNPITHWSAGGAIPRNPV